MPNADCPIDTTPSGTVMADASERYIANGHTVFTDTGSVTEPTADVQLINSVLSAVSRAPFSAAYAVQPSPTSNDTGRMPVNDLKTNEGFASKRIVERCGTQLRTSSSHENASDPMAVHPSVKTIVSTEGSVLLFPGKVHMNA